MSNWKIQIDPIADALRAIEGYRRTRQGRRPYELLCGPTDYDQLVAAIRQAQGGMPVGFVEDGTLVFDGVRLVKDHKTIGFYPRTLFVRSPEQGGGMVEI